MSRPDRLLLHAATLLAAVTGCAVIWMKYFMKSTDPFSVVNHPWQPQMLAAHVLAAPVLVFALGLIARGHILDRLGEGPRNGSGRSGIAATLIVLPMVATGYVLQVATDPRPRHALAVGHLASGLLFTILYALHLLVSWPVARAREGRGRERMEEGSRRGGRALIARGRRR